MKRWLARPIPWVAVLLLIGACGCSRSATVTGKVCYRGQGVCYGSVIFLSSDHTAKSAAIDADGSYAVDGIHPGKVKIGVISHDPRKVLRSRRPQHRGEKGVAAAKMAVKSWSPLPRTFEDPEKSGLECTLDSGHVRYDLDLK